MAAFVALPMVEGQRDFRFHDLRHTFASWARMKGADLQIVASLLGHKSLAMTIRYSHLSAEFSADAVARLDGVFGVLRPQGVPEPESKETKLLVSA